MENTQTQNSADGGLSDLTDGLGGFLEEDLTVKIYFGTPNWGWVMYGIGYKSLWFVGFSMNACLKKKRNA